MCGRGRVRPWRVAGALHCLWDAKARSTTVRLVQEAGPEEYSRPPSPPRLRLAASWSSLTGIWQANPRLGQCPRLAREEYVFAPARRGADVLPVDDPSRTRP